MVQGKQVQESSTTVRGAVQLGTAADIWAGTTAGTAGPLVAQANSILTRRQDPAQAIYLLAAGVAPNARGALALDFQTSRSAATQVASGANAVAFGINATASGAFSIVIGTGDGGGTYANPSASAEAVVAIGPASAASAKWGVAIGARAAANFAAVAVGYNSAASAYTAIAVGYNSVASDSYVVAIGDSSTASVSGTVAVGASSSASAAYAVAVGASSAASGQEGVAVGYACTALAYAAIAMGSGGSASGTWAIAIGVNSAASVQEAIAVGKSSTSSSFDTIAIGAFSTASNTAAIAVGYSSSASNAHAIAVGRSSAASAGHATAIGRNAGASGAFSVCIGSGDAGVTYANPSASAQAAIAIGAGATAGFQNAIALGSNSTVTVANQCAFGARILYIQTTAAPGASPADAIQMYSADFAANNACPYFRTENGTVIGLNQSLLTTASPTFNALTLSTALAMQYGGTGADLSAAGAVGDMLIAAGATTMKRLAGQTTTTRKFLRQTGSGAASADPVWDTLLLADVPSSATARLYGRGTAGAGAGEELALSSDYGVFFTFAAGSLTINTPQNLQTTASPQFAGLVLTSGGKIKPSANSTTAIQFAQADGTAFVTIDTTNKCFGIGTATAPDGLCNIVSPVSLDYSTQGHLRFETKTGSNDRGAKIGAVAGTAGYAYMQGFRPSVANDGNLVLNPNTGNVGIGQSTFGTSAAKVLALATGTAPSTSPADAFQMYSADQAAGNACPYFRTENGTVIGLNQSLLTTASPTFNALTLSTALAMQYGGTGADLSAAGAVGDILIANTATTMKRLSGNTTTTRKFLRQTGSGAASADPVWDTLQAGDIPAGSWQGARSEASATGTDIDVSSIPSWVKRITISLNGVSTNGTSNILVQIGDSGGLETTGYACNCSLLGGSYASTSGTTGYVIYYDNASRTYSGSLVLNLVDATNNVWAASGVLAPTDALGYTVHSAGIKSLSATLDRLRITTASGNTFDAGTISVLWEG